MTTAYPLAWPEGWPRTPADKRASSRFKTGYLDAFDDLLNELRLIGGTGVVVSSNAPLRRDGKPYADAMKDDLDDPGVAVYWRTKAGQPRVMARDGHPTPAENLRAIGLVIEALRAIERHGGSHMMERAFAGFTALPAPGAAKPWHVVLGVRETATREEIEAAHRALIRKHHPDAGGSAEQAAEINRARDDALRSRT